MHYSASFPGTAHSGVYLSARQLAAAHVVLAHADERRALMAVGKAWADGHAACELCKFSALSTSAGDPSRPDTECRLLTQAGGSPWQCPAIKGAS